MGFREQAIIMFVLSAIALPLSIIAPYPYFLLFAVLFVILQLVLLSLFLLRPDLGFDEWYAFWALIAGLAYALILAVAGFGTATELMAGLLVVAYLLSAIYLAFKPRLARQAPVGEGEVEEFRKKDDLNDLIESFEISKAPKDVELDYEAVERPAQEGDSAFDFYEPEPSKPEPLEPAIDKVKESITAFDEGVQSLGEKIRAIGEAAIGESKREEPEPRVSVPQYPEPRKDETVYASTTGEKYHRRRDCVSLKRVDKKDIVAFENPGEARKKGFRVCGMCR